VANNPTPKFTFTISPSAGSGSKDMLNGFIKYYNDNYTVFDNFNTIPRTNDATNVVIGDNLPGGAAGYTQKVFAAPQMDIKNGSGLDIFIHEFFHLTHQGIAGNLPDITVKGVNTDIFVNGGHWFSKNGRPTFIEAEKSLFDALGKQNLYQVQVTKYNIFHDGTVYDKRNQPLLDKLKADYGLEPHDPNPSAHTTKKGVFGGIFDHKPKEQGNGLYDLPDPGDTGQTLEGTIGNTNGNVGNLGSIGSGPSFSNYHAFAGGGGIYGSMEGSDYGPGSSNYHGLNGGGAIIGGMDGSEYGSGTSSYHGFSGGGDITGGMSGSGGYSGYGTTNFSGGGSITGGMNPVLLDLAGTGINISELSRSNKFIDSENSGLLHRTAWAGVGSGVLFYDPNNAGAITQKNQYVFTEWDPTAKGDLEALRNVFDDNGDGVLDASDAKFALFKVEVTNADGSTSVMTLAQLGITSINLKADQTSVHYADGSEVTGQATFTRTVNNVTTTGTVANTVLAAEAQGYAVTQTVTIDGQGTPTVTNTATAADGSIANVTISTTSADGLNITTTYDTNGDGVTDLSQTILTTVDGAGTRTETLTNKNGGGVLITSIQTISTIDGHSITINRDSTGGGWFDQQEVRTIFGDGHKTVVVTDKNADGSEIHQATTTVSIDGLSRSVGTPHCNSCPHQQWRWQPHRNDNAQQRQRHPAQWLRAQRLRQWPHPNHHL
jgi:hypothetical protein